jgi:hypothetical protein
VALDLRTGAHEATGFSVFGEQAVLLDQPHMADVRTLEQTGTSNSRERISPKEGIMYHFATALTAGIIATVLSGIAFVPTPAEAAKMSKAERVALEKATAACKVEAKGMKFSWHWRKRQKYVQNCIIRSASQQGIDIWEIRRAVNMKDLPRQNIDDWSFVFSRSRNR